MKYLSADRIHNGRKWLAEGSVIEMDIEGQVKAVHEPGIISSEQVQHFSGIICPGFVNAHCHLELSYMRNTIPEGKQLVPFLQAVMAGRPQSAEEERAAALKVALEETRKNGIVAVGDITNTTDTLEHRPEAGFHIHTFIESLGFIEEKAEERFTHFAGVYRQFKEQEGQKHLLRQSIVPHAPYSVSGKMFDLINLFESVSIISIHNQETEAEISFFKDKTGAMIDLYRTMNIDIVSFIPSGKTSLQTYLPKMSATHPFILVHNTFMNEDDLVFLKESAYKVFLCLCPNANWYIERRLPPVAQFRDSGLPICLGTDSLASNYELNIWSEVQLLQKHFPDIPLEELICWATYNGARALELDHVIGTIEPGKRPGIVHISKNNSISLIIPA